MIFIVLSTSIALMEIPVEAVMDRFKLSRRTAVIVVAVVTWLIGLPLVLDMAVFGTWADTVTIYLVPIGAVLAGITFFWVNPKEDAHEAITEGMDWGFFKGPWFVQFGRYAFVGVLVLVLILSAVKGGIG